MKRITILAAIFVLLLTTTGRSEDKAVSTITVKIDNLSCTTALGAGTFSVQSWSFGATQSGDLSGGGGSGTGKAVVSDLNLLKQFDECSPALFGGVTTGKHFQTASLVQQEKKDTVMILSLTDVLISSYQLSGSQGNAQPTESVSLSFSKVCVNDVKSGKEACFDFKAQKAE